MKNPLLAVLLSAAFLVPAATLSAKDEKSENHSPSANVIVALKGTAVGEMRPVAFGAQGDDAQALCFDLDLIDLKTGRQIGTATDCLSNIQPVGDGIALVGRTIFNFPGGTLVTRGLTSVQPKTHGSPTVTHITGAIPAPGENSILSGMGRFKNAAGSVRLSGAVKMEPLADGRLQMTFDCIFVIDLEQSGHGR
jgi:hypothetical protein